jgi:hypothetical protein
MAKQMIVRRDFKAWKGLPQGCDWTDWTGPLPANFAEYHSRSLGTSIQGVATFYFEMQGYYRPSISFSEEQKPVLFHCESVSLPYLPALLEMLGKPDAKLDWSNAHSLHPASEFVWAGRGITLFLSSDHDRAHRIALYAATDMSDYLTNLRPTHKEKVPWPDDEQ